MYVLITDLLRRDKRRARQSEGRKQVKPDVGQTISVGSYRGAAQPEAVSVERASRAPRKATLAHRYLASQCPGDLHGELYRSGA